MKEPVASGVGTKIKPEMPEGLQAMITTAPIKSSLDGNLKRHVSTGKRWAVDVFMAVLYRDKACSQVEHECYWDICNSNYCQLSQQLLHSKKDIRTKQLVGLCV